MIYETEDGTVFGILLSLALILGLVQGLSMTAYAEDSGYNLWVGNVRVTSESKDDVRGAGKCSVWVYAQNGVSKKKTVIVQ